MNPRHVRGGGITHTPPLSLAGVVHHPEWGPVTSKPWTPPAVDYAANEPYPRPVLNPSGYATGDSRRNSDAPGTAEWAETKEYQ